MSLGFFSGPADDVGHVGYKFYDRVTLIDAGENTTRIVCSRCDGDIDLDWFWDLIGQHGESFDMLDVTVPCCNAVASLDTLRYEWPVGFARFEMSAINPTRAKYELDASSNGSPTISDHRPARSATIAGRPAIQPLTPLPRRAVPARYLGTGKAVTSETLPVKGGGVKRPRSPGLRYRQAGGSYQGTCRLIHSSTGPVTGRSCHPRDMTSPRIDSAAPRSCFRRTDAWQSLARRPRNRTQLTHTPTSG